MSGPMTPFERMTFEEWYDLADELPTHASQLPLIVDRMASLAKTTAEWIVVAEWTSRVSLEKRAWARAYQAAVTFEDWWEIRATTFQYDKAQEYAENRLEVLAKGFDDWLALGQHAKNSALRQRAYDELIVRVERRPSFKRWYSINAVAKQLADLAYRRRVLKEMITIIRIGTQPDTPHPQLYFLSGVFMSGWELSSSEASALVEQVQSTTTPVEEIVDSAQKIYELHKEKTSTTF